MDLQTEVYLQSFDRVEVLAGPSGGVNGLILIRVSLLLRVWCPA
jgi:hypothetical protein